MIKVNVRVENIPNFDLDLTEDLVSAGEIIASEIRGDIERGLSFTGVPLKPNSPETMRRKYDRTTKFYKRTTKTRIIPYIDEDGYKKDKIILGHKEGELRKIGQAKPLIDIYKKFIATKGVYLVKRRGKNHVTLTLTDRIHPGSNISISDLGVVHNFGVPEKNIPARPFFGVSVYAVKRIINHITKRISDILKGSPSAG